ncbi:hypothetical protein ACIOHC_35380 [Streptomyces sp. NPDC088252]|uniref:hypothetical protein n=1 Tax=Streptomyces sp. NPDC088252 TaxID=3365845 RepID=UPI00381F3CD3
MAQPLQPLAVVLTGAENPYRVLQWLRRSPAARLLGRLVLDPGALNHESLDTLPQRAATAYVRGLLVTAGILPPRDENLALLTNWVARTVAELPARHAHLIRPFAEWHIIRDTRRRSARGRYTYAAHKGDCGNVLAAIDFLNWLDSQHLSLRRLQQPHPDTWATDRPTLRSRSNPFLRWSTARRLCPPGLSIEHPASQLLGHFQAEDEARNELLRCLNDTALPLDVWVAAALIRLYALPLTRIVELPRTTSAATRSTPTWRSTSTPSCSRRSSPVLSTISSSTAPGTATRPGADISCPVTAPDARATPSASPTP